MEPRKQMGDLWQRVLMCRNLQHWSDLERQELLGLRALCFACWPIGQYVQRSRHPLADGIIGGPGCASVWRYSLIIRQCCRG